MEDTLTELHDAKYFSKLNLTEGYYQIKLDLNSKHNTTFATHQRLYQYKILIYGISSTFESLQKQIEITIIGCPKVKNIYLRKHWRNTATASKNCFNELSTVV